MKATASAKKKNEKRKKTKKKYPQMRRFVIRHLIRLQEIMNAVRPKRLRYSPFPDDVTKAKKSK